MTETAWEMGTPDGRLLLTTGVEGPAAKVGHRLTIAVAWQATVQWESGQPVSVEVTADAASLQVQRGDGGVTALSGPEKALARSNALKCLDAKRFPDIRYRAASVHVTGDGYLLDGTLAIHGTTRPRAIALRVEDVAGRWRMSCDAEVSHAEFGLKPYSMMMGAMKVADVVSMSFTAERATGR